MLHPWLEKLRQLNPTRIPPHYLLAAGVLLLLLTTIPLMVHHFATLPRGYISGEAKDLNKQSWDVIPYSGRTNTYCIARLLPEGISLVMRDVSSQVAVGQLNLSDSLRQKKALYPIHPLSAGFWEPVDVDGDGKLDNLLNVNDSTNSYLIQFDSTASSIKVLYRDVWQNPLPDQIWNVTLNVAGAGDFGKGWRVVITRLTRYQLDHREVVILDPVSGEIEARFPLDAYPNFHFGLLAGKNGKSSGFYLTTQATHDQGRQAGEFDDRKGRLLFFTFDGQSWTMRNFYTQDLPMGQSLNARPVKFKDGPAWLICAGDSCFIVNSEGKKTSKVVTLHQLGMVIESCYDEDEDGFSDHALVSGGHEINILSLHDKDRLSIDRSLRIPNSLIGYFNSYVSYVPDSAGRPELLAAVTNDNRLYFFNRRLKQIGEIKLPSCELAYTPSVTSHGRIKRAILQPTGTSEGNVIIGEFNRILSVKYYPQFNRTYYSGVLSVFFFSLGTLLALIGGLTLTIRLLRLSQVEAARRKAFHQAVTTFRRKPSDVNLYMEYLLSDRWQIILDKIAAGTAQALQDLGRPIPHDSLREEIGLPQSGEERLTNLLTLRRVTLYFLAKEFRDIELLLKLNFRLEPRYEKLIQEARTILRSVLKKALLPPGEPVFYSEADLKEQLTELAENRQITNNDDPRRISCELLRTGEDKIQGSLRLSQSAREVKIMLQDGKIEVAYHTKLCPAFTDFMSTIGLESEVDVPHQNLFPEEEEYLKNLNQPTV